MISSEFAAVLRSGRSEFNTRFAMARRQFPALTPEGFSFFLETTVDPVIRSVAAIDPGRVGAVAYAAYDISLSLVGQNLAGAGSRYRFIEDGWQKILPDAARFVAGAPERVIAAVSNALYNIATTPGADIALWQGGLGRVSPLCEDVEIFLKAGQVLAWRSGLAHYRKGALTVLAGLPEEVATSAMDVNGTDSWKEIRQGLENDPWFDPADTPVAEDTRNPSFCIMARVGSFRGFGGLFIEPPRVAGVDENILVKSGTECWLLSTDIFGATFHREDTSQFDKAVRHAKKPAEVTIKGTTVRFRNESMDLAHLGSISSAARNTHTLALTSPLSHAVFLAGLT